MTVAERIPPRHPASPLLWFGVLGAPLAWAAQFGFGYWVSEAKCSPAGAAWGIAGETLALIAGCAAVAMAAAAGLTALSLYRATRAAELDGDPPPARIKFLAIVGMTVAPLFLCLILLSMAGALVSYPCNQS